MQTPAIPSFLQKCLNDFQNLAGIKILRMSSFKCLQDQLTRSRALSEVLRLRIGDVSRDRWLLQEETTEARQALDDLHARVERAGIPLSPGTERSNQTPRSTKAHAVFDPAGRRFPPEYSFVRLPEMPDETYSIDIVDVGAEPLEFEDDIYEPLTRAATCRIIGFDPFQAEGGTPRNISDPASRCHRTIFPYFIGSGGPARFHVNCFRPTSSLFPSNMELLRQFPGLGEMCSTERTIEVETQRLDDVEEIRACDLLKIDVQGGEYDVVAHGTRVLEGTLFVHIETEFSPIYSGQPLFPEIDRFLRTQGFEFIDYVKFGWTKYKALSTPYAGSRLLWADSIYMKEPRRIAERAPLLLLRAAFIAHVNYRKYDLAAHLLRLYDERCGSSLKQAYAATFFT